MQQRKFVFLEAIDSAYVVHSRSLKGHVQLNESKGKTTGKIFIEGIKYEEYAIDVIFEGQKVKNVGHFTGQNKIDYSFIVEESLKKIQAIVIYPLKDRKTIVLVAYLVNRDTINIKEILYFKGGQKTSEKTDVSKAIEEKDKTEVKEREVVQKDIKVEEPLKVKESIKVEEPLEVKESVKEEEIQEPLEEDFIDQHKNEETELPDSNLSSSEAIEESPTVDRERLKETIEKNYSGKINESTPNSDMGEGDKTENKGGIFNNTIFYLWENLDKLDHILEKADPFKQAIQNHKWWYVKEFDTDIQYYCILYNGYLMPMIYPFMNYKNIHAIPRDWIFGVVTEDAGDKKLFKYFVYGIPGRFYMQEQPFRGSTGYLYWQSEDIVKSEPMGYWLLYVDVHTGKIVIPRRPVKPPLNKQIMHNNM